uniref:DNA topoisomerase n=1 Tax=Heterorhabditis bacteriophora TaxID=37862 RepID=A0A1I7XJ47_HETBA
MDLLGQRSMLSITSVSGHLMQLDFGSDMKDWKVNVPISSLFDAPVYHVVPDGMKDIARTLKEESAKCDTLVIWTDCDREGENIGSEIVKVCLEGNRRMDVFRAKFSEITPQAIMNAIQNLLRLDRNIVDAVDCRSELDLRIGAAFTRLQTLHLQQRFAHILCADGFVVERYKAIEQFVTETFWKLAVDHMRNGMKVIIFIRFTPKYCYLPLERIFFRWNFLGIEFVYLIRTLLKYFMMTATNLIVQKLNKSRESRRANTGPRTETNKFPKDINLIHLVQQQTASEEWNDFADKVLQFGPNPRNGIKTDEAHPPIHPLKFASKSQLLGNDWRLYELIVRHFLACVSWDAKGHETKISMRIGGETFHATGLQVDDLGYMHVYIYDKWSDKTLPVYVEGEQLTDHQLRICDGQTQPPQLLNEGIKIDMFYKYFKKSIILADLIALMDKFGIGTDATHAEHIEKIKVCYAMSKPQLRADLERQLQAICAGERTKEQVLEEQKEKYKRIFVQTEAKINLLSQALSRYLNNNGGRPAPAVAEIPSSTVPSVTNTRGRGSRRGRGGRLQIAQSIYKMGNDAELTQQMGNDNIIAHRKFIAKSIEVIRVKKDQILKTLKGISENEQVMKSIVDIHEKATEDVAKDIEQINKTDNSANITEEANLKEDQLELIRKELQEVALQTSLAAELNNKLVETLQMHKRKKTAMQELRLDKTKEVKNRASEALNEMEHTKHKVVVLVSSSRADINRKQRELDELRKEALKKGIQLGEEEQKQKDAIVEAVIAVTNDAVRIPPISNDVPQSKTVADDTPSVEERRKQIRENVRKERERKEQINQQIRERLLAMEARKERMKQIRLLLTEYDVIAPPTSSSIKKDQENCVVEENESKDMGNEEQLVPEEVRVTLEQTFLSAELNLRNLTAMRMRLEEMQLKGETIPNEDAELIDEMMKKEDALTNEAALEGEHEEKKQIIEDENPTMLKQTISNSISDEIEKEVRDGFSYVFDHSSLRATDDNQLNRIECLLLQQARLLSNIHLKLPATGGLPVSSLRSLLLAAHPQVVRSLGIALLRLSEGDVDPQLDNILTALSEPSCFNPPEKVLGSTRSYIDNFESVIANTQEKNHIPVKQLFMITVRDVVISGATGLFVNVPISLVESQLGPIVMDTMMQYISLPMTTYGPLAEVAVGATLLFVLGASAFSRRPAVINGLLIIVTVSAIVLYSFLQDKRLLEIPGYLLGIVFEPSIMRRCLLVFWLINVLASLIFGMLVTIQGHSSTRDRKFFHLTISLIYLSGIFLDKDFLWLCGWLSLCIFIIVEVLRFHQVPPWGEVLNSYLLVFKDSQDAQVLLTPIFLLSGVFLPLFLAPNDSQPHLYHLAGVAAVGVGDSLAAIVGSKLGSRKWPGMQKTMEGSAAMVLSMTSFLLISRTFCAEPKISPLICILVAIVLTVIEAFVKNIDNVLLPLVGYFIL